MLKSVTAVLVAGTIAIAAGARLQELKSPAGDWPFYGGDQGGMKYSPLTAINASTVRQLGIAWEWSPREKALPAFGTRPGNFQATPLMIENVLYLSTPYNRVVALNADTGAELWAFDPKAYEDGQPPNGTGFVHRGVAAWRDSADGDELRIFINSRYHLICLDAASGRPVDRFGTHGAFDLSKGLVWEINKTHYTNTSPPIVYKDLVILGNGVGDRLVYRNDPPGDIRAFDARTGRQVWSFKPIPQPGQFGNETWGNDSWSFTGHTNAWPPMTLDAARGLVYVPLGTPSNDFYGGRRPGANVFAESLVCLDAATGVRKWHAQLVHHGLWDYDNPSPPNLVTIRVDGRTIDAVVQLTKQGFAFVFDRVTGKPVWPIEERPVPPSDVEGEHAWGTQPVPTRPPPIAEQGVTLDDAIDFTPALKAAAQQELKKFRIGPLFTPPSLRGTVQRPGLIGGANWGGGAFDPSSGVLFVKTTNQANIARLGKPDTSEKNPRASEVDAELVRVGDTNAEFMDGLPLLKPPYGHLVAIDLNRGAIKWRVPFGDTPSLRRHPALKGVTLPAALGAAGAPGVIVTAGGLVIGGGGDLALHAVDAATGAQVWQAALPRRVNGTPMLYRSRSGRQFVVVATGGGEDASLVAFALDGTIHPGGLHLIAALILALATSVSGVVHDPSGGVVSGAAVIVRSGSGPEQRTTTGPDGRFSIETPETGEVTIVVRAGGFAEKTQKASASSAAVDIVVEPATLFETVTVTPTRTEQRLGDTPASVSVVSSEAIESSPALTADDVLRNVPSFSLFRRTSALAAQPTAQGVSLRGIGPSGQSRTLVLLDGVPFNDPFGGWVYWTRVPLVSVDRVEITEDASSSLYGNIAMGGVINIFTSHPTRRTVEVKTQYGNHDSPKLDFFASDQWNKVAAAVEGSFLHTDGFPIVAAIERGPIDNNANVEYKNVTGKLEFTPNDRFQGFFRAGYFSENRNNAKVGEVNDTRWTTVNGGIRARLKDDSDLQARIFGDVQRAHFNFLAVTAASATVPARSIVRLATDQNVPTDGVGGMAQWTKAFGARNAFSAGFDFRWVDGESQEAAYVPTVPTSIAGVTQAATLSVRRFSGGAQQSLGAFVQDIFTPIDKLVLTLSARVDRWNNYNGHNLETTVATGPPTVNNRPSIPDSNETVVSPHLGALFHASDRVSLWGAANSGFRAPTLTELYRQFSVGAITTRPNENLAPERLLGGEAGVNVAPAKNVSVRLTYYVNRLTNPVLNVTLNATTAQKQNVPETQVNGLQTDIDYRIGSSWRFSAGYVYSDAKVTDGGTTNPPLGGKVLQQVPKHRGSFQAAYSNARIATVALSVQFVGLQYNDDLNTNLIPAATLTASGYDTAGYVAGLPGYSSVDLSASRNFGSNLQVFFGVQNLLDKEYFVQTNPSTIGTPRLVNGGVRIRFSGR